jgi:hypothetical protein
MEVAADSLCMGCMNLKQGGLCPNPAECGWQDETEAGFIPQLRPHTVLDGRYVLGRVLGQGGFGITYLAAELNDYRKLAIKEYFPFSFATRTNDRHTATYAGPDNREPYQYGLKKFEEEAQTLERFQNCPGIVAVLRSFKANGTGYIVMEYLEGTTLLAYLNRQQGGAIPFAEAIRIVLPIMHALRETHRVGMIHRDVSPDNIYLCRSGEIKLLDFGAARVAFADQAQSQQLILKPGYTPEEQYRSKGVAGPYTDIYSLGATIYRSLTGQLPPEAPERLSDDRLKPPGRFSELPPGARKALLKALAVHAKDRYRSIAEFQRDLVPRSLPAPRDATAFLVWWTVGCALIMAGIAVHGKGGIWLFCAGLVPALVGIGFAPVVRAGGARSALFAALAVCSAVLTAVTPYAAVLLLVPLFTARPRRAAADTKGAPARPRFMLRCTAGELAGNELELGAKPIVIGRLPDKANVVIPLPQVSAAHARVWVDGGLWIEDLDSRNGTYVQLASAAGWEKVQGRRRLSKGDRFYLSGEELATFEVESTEPA